jgi:hypothetical protein
MRIRLLGVVAAGLGLVAFQLQSGEAATGYTLQTSTFGSTRLLDRWNPCQKAITYAVNPALAGASAPARAAAVLDVQRAFAAVHAATGMTFRYVGITTYIPTGHTWTNATNRGGEPAEIVVAWVDARHPSSLLVPGAAGVGGFAVRASRTGAGAWIGYVGRGYVVLDASQNRFFKPGFGAGVTRGELLLHEIGHTIGLGHTSLASQIMYPILQPRSVAKYGGYDLLGLKRLGRTAGCIYVPGLWQDLS